MKPGIRDSQNTTKSFRRRKVALDKGLWPTLLAVLVVGGLLLGAQPAYAAPCMQDNYTASGKTQTLNCTANDVRIAEVTDITGIQGIFTDPDTGELFCLKGSPIQFTADFDVDLTAQARYDIGLYLAQGQTQARTGTCTSSIITDQNNTTNFITQ